MAALERFDQWEEGLDEDGLSPAAGADTFADLYDPQTRRAIEGGGPQPGGPAAPGRSRGGLAAGVMAASLMGTATALEDDPEAEPMVELDLAPDDARQQAVTVHLAWGNPSASVAIVRPWLL